MPRKPARPIDATGWRILEELQQNARIPFNELAKKVNLSPTAVIERVKRMEDDGVITGYRAAIDPQRAGYSFCAILSLAVTQRGRFDILDEKLASIPEVVSCWSVTGSQDYLLELHSPSLEFLQELLIELETYGRVTTSIVLPRSDRKMILLPPRESLAEE